MIIWIKSAALHISIHAPTRGATLSDIKELVELENFNPRSYKRSDFYP